MSTRSSDRQVTEVVVRPATASDADAIAVIYNHYIRETVVTFEEDEVSPTEMTRRVQAVGAIPLPWLVAELDSRVTGYAYATKWKERTAYRFSAEVTVYLAPQDTGRGIGSRLYGEMFRILRECRTHAVIGGITLPNDASVALHEKFGLTKVAHFAEVGFKFGRWLDVGYWQRIL